MFMTELRFYSDLHTLYTHCFSISEKTSDEMVMTM